MQNRRAIRGASVRDSFNAESWNYVMDAAGDLRNRTRNGLQPYQDIKSSTIISVRNTSGQTLLAGDCVKITGPTAKQTGNLEDSSSWNLERVLLDVDIADEASGRIAILRNTVADGNVTTATVNGMSHCRLFVPTDGTGFSSADFDTGDKSRLSAVVKGPAEIIWKDTGENTTVDAVVNLGPRSASGSFGVWENTLSDSLTVAAGSKNLLDGNSLMVDFIRGDSALMSRNETTGVFTPTDRSSHYRADLVLQLTYGSGFADCYITPKQNGTSLQDVVPYFISWDSAVSGINLPYVTWSWSGIFPPIASGGYEFEIINGGARTIAFYTSLIFTKV